jgi:hypothetical protein
MSTRFRHSLFVPREFKSGLGFYRFLGGGSLLHSLPGQRIHQRRLGTSSSLLAGNSLLGTGTSLLGLHFGNRLLLGLGGFEPHGVIFVRTGGDFISSTVQETILQGRCCGLGRCLGDDECITARRSKDAG